MGGSASGDLACFLDCDLAILGEPAASYARYVERIKLEYAHAYGPGFAAKRAAVMRTFVATDVLYFSRGMRAEREAAARANVGAELLRLDAASKTVAGAE